MGRECCDEHRNEHRDERRRAGPRAPSAARLHRTRTEQDAAPAHRAGGRGTRSRNGRPVGGEPVLRIRARRLLLPRLPRLGGAAPELHPHVRDHRADPGRGPRQPPDRHRALRGGMDALRYRRAHPGSAVPGQGGGPESGNRARHHLPEPGPGRLGAPGGSRRSAQSRPVGAVHRWADRRRPGPVRLPRVAGGGQGEPAHRGRSRSARLFRRRLHAAGAHLGRPPGTLGLLRGHLLRPG